MQFNKKLLDRIVTTIEKNPDLTWSSMYDKSSNMINAETGDHYSGSNPLFLTLQLMNNGQKSSLFCTYVQAQKLGLELENAKGMGCLIHRYQRIYKDSNGKTIKAKDAELRQDVTSFPLSAWHTVFSFDSIKDCPKKRELEEKYKAKTFDNNNIDNIETDINNYLTNQNIGFNHADCTPCYIPSKDAIQMPKLENFYNTESYYSVFLHEIAHSTGHEKRLNRKLKGQASKVNYANEELIAELSASNLSNYYKIDNDKLIDNASAYLKSWLSVISENPNILIGSAAKAEKACNYYLESASNQAQAVA